MRRGATATEKGRGDIAAPFAFRPCCVSSLPFPGAVGRRAFPSPAYSAAISAVSASANCRKYSMAGTRPSWSDTFGAQPS